MYDTIQQLTFRLFGRIDTIWNLKFQVCAGNRWDLDKSIIDVAIKFANCSNAFITNATIFPDYILAVKCISEKTALIFFVN